MPGPNGPGPNRRQFLVRAAILAAAAPTLGALAAACSKPPAPSSGEGGGLKIASPSNPVKWDIPADNQPIADGLAPEKGATL
ncbi:MAG: spermidine/putrescine transport system substrate-binding protein, partial [Mycobacterium sp.]|nr:spermidine/putrescine transport system substrate-binding protein [Mycobacterium sp.]